MCVDDCDAGRNPRERRRTGHASRTRSLLVAGYSAPMERIGRLGWIQVDCADPVRLATFWSQVLGTEIDRPWFGDPPHYVGLIPLEAGQPVLTFHRVPEAKTTKNRLHLDVAVDEVEAATTRVVGLGGGRSPAADVSEYGFHWRVMLDPEGNEFCLIHSLQ